MIVLVMAAHPDDEVLGCGGTICRHVDEGDKVHILFVADGETARLMKAQPNRNIAATAAAKVMGAEVYFLDHPDQRLDQLALLDLTREVEEWGRFIKPEIVYTHFAGDRNMDHRIVHDITMTAFRPVPGCTVKQIHAYSVLSSTEWGGWPFTANHFVNVTGTRARKRQALRCYEDEMREPPHPRSFANVNSADAVCGSIIGVDHAEAFITLRSIR